MRNSLCDLANQCYCNWKYRITRLRTTRHRHAHASFRGGAAIGGGQSQGPENGAKTARNEMGSKSLKTNDSAKWPISRPQQSQGLAPAVRNRSFRLREMNPVVFAGF